MNDRWAERRDAAIRCLKRLKADFKMAGANATSIERAIQTLETAPLAPEPIVKALKWSDGSLYGAQYADSPCGRYTAFAECRVDESSTRLASMWVGPRGNKYPAKNIAEAKADAQADYESRILSALVGNP